MSRTVDERVLRDAIERLAFLETRRGHTRNREYDAALDHLAAALSAERERAEAAERLAERQRDALIGLQLVTGCWCTLEDHDYGCRAAAAAIAASLPDGER